jgi:nitrate/nitrite-specific signal transduction histidine kinase
VHDNLAQALGYLSLKVGLLEEQLGKGQYVLAQSSVREMTPIVEQAYVDARETIFNLRSASTASGMFLASLLEYLRDYKMHYGVDVQLSMDDAFRAELPVRAGLQVTRIVQEAIANIRKHAGVCNAGIHLDQDEQWMHIVVEDDGVGFDATRQENAGEPHYGLQIMRERAESVGGTLMIDSAPGKGTRVTITAPLTDESEDTRGHDANHAGG